jgi:hypothetical protein
MISVLHHTRNLDRESYSLGKSNDLGFINQNFTIMVWINITKHNIDNQCDNTILATSHNLNANEALHIVIRHGRPYFGFYGDDTESPHYIPPGKWCHLTFIFNLYERSQSIYINGNLSVKTYNHKLLNGNNTIELCKYAGGRSLNGRSVFLSSTWNRSTDLKH